ncbi:MAG: hypothetical protein ACXADY_21985 [Candidatus Hodarchaeales archaeon]
MKAIAVLRGMAVQLPWLRESFFYISLNPGCRGKQVKTALEYLRPGFDQESIQIALDLSRDLKRKGNTITSLLLVNYCCG